MSVEAKLSIYLHALLTHPCSERESGTPEFYIIQLHQSEDVPHQSRLLVPRIYITAAWQGMVGVEDLSASCQFLPMPSITFGEICVAGGTSHLSVVILYRYEKEMVIEQENASLCRRT